jgi:PAS domain-containing protein
MKNQQDTLNGAHLLSRKNADRIDSKSAPAPIRKKATLNLDGGNGSSLIFAEELIRQSASLFDLVNDAIIAKALDGTIAQLNPAAERMFGYSASEIVGRPMQLLFPSSRLQEADDMAARVKPG